MGKTLSANLSSKPVERPFKLRDQRRSPAKLKFLVKTHFFHDAGNIFAFY